MQGLVEELYSMAVGLRTPKLMLFSAMLHYHPLRVRRIIMLQLMAFQFLFLGLLVLGVFWTSPDHLEDP